MDLVLNVCSDVIKPVNLVKDFGVIVDQELTLCTYASSACRVHINLSV